MALASKVCVADDPSGRRNCILATWLQVAEENEIGIAMFTKLRWQCSVALLQRYCGLITHTRTHTHIYFFLFSHISQDITHHLGRYNPFFLLHFYKAFSKQILELHIERIVKKGL